MPDMIRSGTGNGYLASVNKTNQLEVRAQSESLQHSQSVKNQQAYQVKAYASLIPGIVTPIHIKNTSKTKNLVVTYIRHQVVGATGGTTFPNTNNYFRVSFGRTYDSGGTALTPINMFRGSGNTAGVEAYKEPVLNGTITDFDDWFTKADGDMNSFNKEGALIVAPNNTLELSYFGDHTGGICYARLSFIMKEIEV